MATNPLAVGLPHGLCVILGGGGGKTLRRSSFGRVTKKWDVTAAVLKDDEQMTVTAATFLITSVNRELLSPLNIRGHQTKSDPGTAVTA